MTATQQILAAIAGWLLIAVLGGLLIGAAIHHADTADTRHGHGQR